ncbi:hypothetical protein RJ641_029103 [Dillenia turbinata]|uniref:GPI inositol-deacylase n=1 Tax=Dillenia turbinata TaxID=194707 RepID=A0AAN8ZJ38_9MAGN
MKQTGVAASVLWQSLRSVMSSASQEVRHGFELKVAALLADIAASSSSRRAAIVAAGGGRVVDWLMELETVAAVSGENSVTQAESARALAYLLADHRVCEDVLARPNAVLNLLRFIFASQPQRSKKLMVFSPVVQDQSECRSMLVAAIMDIVTSSCDSFEKVSFHPSLPANAEMRDIAAAIEVIEEGGMHLDESNANEDDDAGASGFVEFEDDDSLHLVSAGPTPSNLVFQKLNHNLQLQRNMSSVVVPGLWDDLLCQHVAVPFAACALASWEKLSELNRSHIQELDQDGFAVMAALMAPERTVKWHGSLVACLLLEDNNLPLNDSVSDWCSSLLSTISHTSKTKDIPLAQVTLSAFLVSVERCPRVQQVVMEKGLNLMRESAKQTMNHKQVQEALAKALELLCTRSMHFSLEESRKWSGILLQWVCGKDSSASTRSSAIKILSCMFEEYGPSSLPISQGWLAILLAGVLGSSKRISAKGISQPKSDKTQIDQANLISAAQVAGQLAGAVVNLAAKQLGGAMDSVDIFPLADFLSLEPFSGPYKNINTDNLPKLDAADSAVATLKGIKALTDIYTDDSSKNKIIDLGILCLLRRFLLRDDYEKLAAIQAYHASRSLEAQERGSTASSESSVLDINNSSSIRVPPTAHIRRHAARLLSVLSVLPNAREVITADEIWCKWLEDCADDGKVPGCNDPKIQSYAGAMLLHVYCDNKSSRNSADNNGPDSVNSLNCVCPRYDDMIFLISPERQHWKWYGKKTANSVQETAKPNPSTKSSAVNDDSMDNDDLATTIASKDGSRFIYTDESDHSSQLEVPPLDVVFVHGLCGGSFKSWRITEDKSSTQSGLIERIAQEAGKLDTFWPGEWLPDDFPYARIFSLKYKTNLTQWSGATRPLQEVSSILLDKLVAAGIGDRPVVFVTHSMGGLVVKQILYQAKAANLDNFVNNTIGVVFYSYPHFGSKLADMPWRMGLVLRPAPTIGELRSGSPRLVELNDYIRQLHKKGCLRFSVLVSLVSVLQTKVTPIVEGYGGWAFRMEFVPIESAYPGFGELVVLESTDHINSCKPVSRSDPSYTETIRFLNKLKTKLHVNG